MFGPFKLKSLILFQIICIIFNCGFLPISNAVSITGVKGNAATDRPVETEAPAAVTLLEIVSTTPAQKNGVDEGILRSENDEVAEKLDEKVFAEFGKNFRPRFPQPDPNMKEEAIDLDYKPDHVKILPGSKDKSMQKILTGVGQCSCGTTGSPPKIVGGKEADISEYPWTVGLIESKDNKLFCGGTIISDLYVLTASHCVQSYRRNPSEIYIALSKTVIEPAVLPTLSAGFRAEVDKIIMHPDYNPFTINNDVALIKLKKRIRITMLSPVCLPASENNDFAGFNGTVVGWGTKDEDSQDTSKKLQQVSIPILTNRRCIEDTIDHNYDRVTSNMLCAGVLEKGGQDSCQGDSGGPLVVNLNKRGVLVGVVSWGVGCARPKSPGVYARVSRYASWIRENTKDGQYCGGSDQIQVALKSA